MSSESDQTKIILSVKQVIIIFLIIFIGVLLTQVLSIDERTTVSNESNTKMDILFEQVKNHDNESRLIGAATQTKLYDLDSRVRTLEHYIQEQHPIKK